MSAHTPGPWEYSDEDAEPCVVAGDYYVATAHVGQPGDGIAVAPQAHANARLIAAAPDLLAACHALLAAEPLIGELCDGACKPGINHHVSGCAVGLALTAIAKAEGES